MMLKNAEEVSFMFEYMEDGVWRQRPKMGLLVQLGRERVQHQTEEPVHIATRQVTELTMEIYKNAMPAAMWQEACNNLKAFLMKAVQRTIGKEYPYLSFTGQNDKGDSLQATVKVEPKFAEVLFREMDRHHVFCRKTLWADQRDEEMRVLWLPAESEAPLPTRIRETRERAKQAMGKDYCGLAIKGRSPQQLGVRVTIGMEAVARTRLLPQRYQPPEELRDVRGEEILRTRFAA